MRTVARALMALILLLLAVVPASGQTPDPRSDNARAFSLDASGKVAGVELQVDERPWTSYQLVQARLIDEASAGGNTVARYVVVDCQGTPISENVYLAWPWPSLVGAGSGKLLPGNQNNEHMVINWFNPPDLGPLALYIGDSQGRVNSDVIGGLGLPFKRHVSYYVAWRKRCPGGVATPAPTATSPPVSPPAPTGDLSETNDLLREILAALRALAQHLGVTP